MRTHKEKITGNMTTKDALVVMSDGNPGAVTVLLQILERSDEIDLDNALGGIGKILDLDSCGIYSSHIWVFYKDLCGENLSKMLGVLRAVQLGFLNRQTLKDACSREDYSGRKIVDVEELCKKVKEQLPAFKFDE